jgi:hypothetical protein
MPKYPAATFGSRGCVRCAQRAAVPGRAQNRLYPAGADIVEEIDSFANAFHGAR